MCHYMSMNWLSLNCNLKLTLTDDNLITYYYIDSDICKMVNSVFISVIDSEVEGSC